MESGTEVALPTSTSKAAVVVDPSPLMKKKGSQGYDQPRNLFAML